MPRKPKGTSAAKSATKIEAAGSVPDVPSKLAEAISNKRCAVFVGAGLSTRAGYPSWAKLLERLIAKCGETAGRSQAQMEELRELAKRPDRYLMLAQEISDILGEERFRTELVDVFRTDNDPTDAHKKLMTVPFSLAVTTNYDTLLEKAYISVRNKLPTSYVHNQAADFADALWRGEFFILKAHGDVQHRPSMVITERDYRKIIHSAAGYRSVMASIFTTKTVLFLGVSLSDPELNLMLAHLHDSFYGGTPFHFALVPANEFEDTAVNRWSKDFGITCLRYSPDANHTQVEKFIEQLRDSA